MFRHLSKSKLPPPRLILLPSLPTTLYNVTANEHATFCTLSLYEVTNIVILLTQCNYLHLKEVGDAWFRPRFRCLEAGTANVIDNVIEY